MVLKMDGCIFWRWQISLNTTSLQSKSFKDGVSLWHAPFLVLKLVFLDMLRSVESFKLQCEVCQLAKHWRHSFQASNEKSNIPFQLIVLMYGDS